MAMIAAMPIPENIKFMASALRNFTSTVMSRMLVTFLYVSCCMFALW